MKIYTLENQFIEETSIFNEKNFTGIIKYNGDAAFWYKDGLLHRENGPAVEWANGAKCYYINGVPLLETTTEDSFKLLIKIRKLKNLL